MFFGSLDIEKKAKKDWNYVQGVNTRKKEISMKGE